MKFSRPRHLYVIVIVSIGIGIATCCLFVGGLVERQDSGIGAGWRFAGYLQRVPVVPACDIIVAVGVIWLGWYGLKLAGAIAPTANLLTQDNRADVKRAGRLFNFHFKGSQHKPISELMMPIKMNLQIF